MVRVENESLGLWLWLRRASRMRVRVQGVPKGSRTGFRECLRDVNGTRGVPKVR